MTDWIYTVDQGRPGDVFSMQQISNMSVALMYKCAAVSGDLNAITKIVEEYRVAAGPTAWPLVAAGAFTTVVHDVLDPVLDAVTALGHPEIRERLRQIGFEYSTGGRT